ncbi:PIN domain-containing protein [Tianweitania populi]|uniref:PIN domain-containing protein n=1 Tax=Tianweitania populi TaxID=1607949 RepID=A0A8J3DYZ0_9HYPH|nr:hypothetical protein GCM10016234_34830 [Tianweitania populi]
MQTHKWHISQGGASARLAQDLLLRFEHRVLAVNEPVALVWGNLMGLAKRRGRGLSSMDGLIAATAIANKLTLATRNIKDFDAFEIDLYNPGTP